MTEIFKTISFTIQGIRPLLMHNGILSDPMSQQAQIMKAESKKKEKDYAKIAKIEWIGGLYWNKELGYYIPSDNIDSMMAKAAALQKKKAAVVAGVMSNAEIGFSLQTELPKDPEEAFEDPRFRLTKGVVVQRNRIMRTRPMIPTGWKMDIEFQYDTSMNIKPELIREILEEAGLRIGLGDWRPKFGRFYVL